MCTYMHTYIYMYIYMYIFIFRTCTYVNIHTHIHIHVYVHIHLQEGSLCNICVYLFFSVSLSRTVYFCLNIYVMHIPSVVAHFA